MFRQSLFFLAVCMFGMIKSQNFYIPTLDDMENVNVEINGDLLIDTTSNTDKEIAHQQITYEPLRLIKDVEGILHYSIGARIPSKWKLKFILF